MSEKSTEQTPPNRLARLGEAIQHINSSLRTVIAGGALLLLAAISYTGYQLFAEPRAALDKTRQDLSRTEADLQAASQQLAEREQQIGALSGRVQVLAASNDALQKSVDRLTTSIKLLRLKHRLARLTVREQSTNDEGQILTKFDFVEINEEGQPISETQTLEVVGDRVYVEYLVVKFDDSYVAQADIERGTSICLIQRIFGERQQPADGFVVDRVGTRPTAYGRGTPVSEFEQQIWDDFWTIANDRAKAEALGIRAIQAEAPSLRVVEGKTYEIDIRSSGDFSFLPVSP
jgi:hypothetical protein